MWFQFALVGDDPAENGGSAPKRESPERSLYASQDLDFPRVQGDVPGDVEANVPEASRRLAFLDGPGLAETTRGRQGTLVLAGAYGSHSKRDVRGEPVRRWWCQPSSQAASPPGSKR